MEGTKIFRNIFKLIGIVFIPISVIYILIGFFAPFLMLGAVIFLPLGIFFLRLGIKMERMEQEILEKGKRYRVKIYGHSENYNHLVNDKPTLNVEVRYFDENGNEQNTFYSSGSTDVSDYPIGKSITMSLYKGNCYLHLDSIGDDVLYAEELLMDDKPIGAHVHLVATQCKNCGASLYEADGFVYKCPYCGSYGNAEYKEGTLTHWERMRKKSEGE